MSSANAPTLDDALHDALRFGCLESDAWLLLDEGDLGEAGRHFERLVGAALILSEPNRLVLARALGGLGAVRMRGLDLEGARGYFSRALAIAERLRGTDADRELASSLSNLGNSLSASGRYQRARPLFERAVAIWERGGALSRSQLVDALDELARVQWMLGDYARAQGLYERALAIAEQELKGDPLAIAANLGGYGRVLHSMGDYARARSFLERARTLVEEAGGRDHQLLGVLLSDLGAVLIATGDPVRARTAYQHSLRIFEAQLGPQHPYVASSIANLATLAASRNSRDARKSLEKALAVHERIYGPEHPDLAAILRNLAAVAVAEGRSGEAKSRLRRALIIQEKALTPDHPRVALTLNQLAVLEARLGDAAESTDLLKRALSVQEKSLSESHPDLALTHYLLARNHAFAGGSEAALDAALKAEAISGAHLSRTAQRLSEADALRYASIRISSRDLILSLAVEGLATEGLRSVWNAVIRSRALVLDAVAARRRAGGRNATQEVQAAADELATTSRQLSNLIIRGADATPSIEAYRRLLDDAREAREAAERRLAERVVPFRLDLARQRIGLNDVSLSLPLGSALVAYIRYNHYERANEGGRGFPGSQLRPSYLAFVLRSGDSEIVVRSLGAAPVLDAHMSAWRRAVVNPGGDSEAAYRDVAAQLRRRVWDPIADAVGDAERVFMVPDGPLHLLNWAALPADEGRYLAEAGPLFHYLSAERDLVREEGSRQRAQGILALGGPDFDDFSSFSSLSADRPPPQEPLVHVASLDLAKGQAVRGGAAGCEGMPLRFDPLPGATREAQGIARLWQASQASQDGMEGDSTLLLGSEATEAAFKSAARQRRILHLATHGFVLGDSCLSGSGAGARGVGGLAFDTAVPATPSASDSETRGALAGLAMAGANHHTSAAADEEDGILTAEEIAAMDLSGVEWAVLSGCDTGLGEIRASEGVFGLRRAFQVAGVGSLIMSLWSVGDTIAERWMLALYGARLDHHRQTAEAVRDANLRLLEERRESGLSTHPFYWAAFVAAGDWR